MNGHTHNARVKRLRWLFVAGAIAIIAMSVWGIRWATFARQPLPAAIQALASDEGVEVTSEPWLTFTPRQPAPNVGFVFYPGGRIDPRGYAPLMKAIASEGYLVVVPEMPVNMAVFRPNVADQIMAEHPEIARWAIGGHSVGGVMAAQYTNAHREALGGLVLWAAYPASSADLGDSGLPVTLIYGSQDPAVDDGIVAEHQRLLPEDTRYVRIDGGDHHEFGSYKIRPSDHHATIDRASQQNQIIRSTLSLLEAVSGAQ